LILRIGLLERNRKKMSWGKAPSCSACRSISSIYNKGFARILAGGIPDEADLALASWYRIQYLVTWNCKHLANANKFEHIQVLNTRRRLLSPLLVTPEQLLEMPP
jgi:hypothetical protein